MIDNSPAEVQSSTLAAPPLSALCQPDLNVSPIGQARGISIASLVLGVASIPFANFVLGAVGLVFALRGLRRTPSGVNNRFAKVGKVCSIIGIILSIMLACAIIGFIVYQTHNTNKPMSF